ncbi:MAG TPA: MBL fold metallo-hydrolase [Pyrinomonadaceae bacterium]|nr:MBL fold metallo-hydrolase [Pyrinomonadaceae bacterium]
MGVAMDQRADQQVDWAEGKFQILFVSIGQGDCCVITCPNGEHIMVDCGSKASEVEGMAYVWALIRGPWVLSRPGTKQMHLSALILTHPDKDHVNKVAYMIAGSKENAVPVDAVYFSDAKNSERFDFKSSPLRMYGAGKCGSTLRTYCKVKNLYCVTLKNGEETLHSWEPPFGADQYSTEDFLIDDARVRVAHGEIGGDEDDDEEETEKIEWEVSIIAGNVPKEDADHSDADGRNAASLVTLVRRDNERVLICGDATRSTQNYLYNTFKTTDDIKFLTMLQVPHHGSSLTAATDDFLKLVRPRKAVISVRLDEHTHHHPGMQVVEAYMAHARKSEAQSLYRGWQKVADGDFQTLRTAWEAGQVKYTPSAKTGVRRYVRDDTKGVIGPIILDKVGAPATAAKYVLYQRQTDRDIRQTGYGPQWLYLE